MLVKLTSKNQLTLPKSVLRSCQGAEYFEVSEEDGRIVLTPVRMTRPDGVRSSLARLGIDGDAVAEAVDWARRDGDG